jgi:hypothetical protein
MSEQMIPKETEHVMNEIQKVPERRDDAQSLMELILRPDISEDRLRFLTATHKDMVDRQARLEYFAAKAQMGPEMPVIEKKGKISYESKRTGKSRSTPYELWEDVVEIITPVCSKFGFSIDHQAWTEPPEVPPGKVKVTTYLRHIGGHWEQTSFVAPLDSSGEKNVIQQAKSTVSYLKRINAGLLINFVARGEDNDGADGPETASGGATLSDEQIKQLEANIKAVKLDRAMFLAKYKLSEVSELAANKFQVAMSDVTAYGRKHKEPTK